MRRKVVGIMLFGAAIAAIALYLARNVLATPASGFVGTTLAVGRFRGFEVFNRVVLPNSSPGSYRKNVWQSEQETKGLSDVYVQSNVWQPGGTTGWHTHPGHSLIIVTAGTVTAYEGDDPECKPHVYTQGMGFVDHGGDHVHIIRNEGDVAASTVAVQLIPAGAVRRIDAAAPGTCAF